MPSDIGEDFEKFGPKRPNWQQLEQWCRVAIRYWEWEWKCACAHRSMPEPEDFSKEIGIWTLKLIHDPKAKHEPPASMRPWILARLLFAAFWCKQAADTGRAPLGDPRQALSILVIGDWKDRPVGFCKSS